MASDHLWIHILFGSLSHKALLYSPSTIQILKEELSLRHGVSVTGMDIFYEGVIQGDRERIVDGRRYEVRAPPPAGGEGRGAVEEGVFLGEGVTLTQDVVVAHRMGAQVIRRKEEEEGIGQKEDIYTVFGFRGVLHLVEHQRRCVLGPAGTALPPRKAIFYVDWVTLRPLLLLVPQADHDVWLHQQLRQVYGVVEGMYRTEGIHKADADEMVRYQNVAMNWLDAMGISEEEDEFDELDELEWEEQEEMEEIDEMERAEEA